MSNWVSFREESVLPGKTRILHVHSTGVGEVQLGTIKWNGAMRGYAFYPVREMIGLAFSEESIREVYEKIAELRVVREKEKESA